VPSAGCTIQVGPALNTKSAAIGATKRIRWEGERELIVSYRAEIDSPIGADWRFVLGWVSDEELRPLGLNRGFPASQATGADVVRDHRRPPLGENPEAGGGQVGIGDGAGGDRRLTQGELKLSLPIDPSVKPGVAEKIGHLIAKVVHQS
jgi:hypothetical protein